MSSNGGWGFLMICAFVLFFILIFVLVMPPIVEPHIDDKNPLDSGIGLTGTEELRIATDDNYSENQTLVSISGWKNLLAFPSFNLFDRHLSVPTFSAGNLYAYKSNQDIKVAALRLYQPDGSRTRNQMVFGFCDVTGVGVGFVVTRTATGLSFSSSAIKNFTPTSSSNTQGQVVEWTGGIFNLAIKFENSFLMQEASGAFESYYSLYKPFSAPSAVRYFYTSQESSDVDHNFIILDMHLFTLA